jgi:hypothetical protein
MQRQIASYGAGEDGEGGGGRDDRQGSGNTELALSEDRAQGGRSRNLARPRRRDGARKAGAGEGLRCDYTAATQRGRGTPARHYTIRQEPDRDSRIDEGLTHVAFDGHVEVDATQHRGDVDEAV